MQARITKLAEATPTEDKLLCEATTNVSFNFVSRDLIYFCFYM